MVHSKALPSSPANEQAGLNTLPNELLLNILSTLTTRELLPTFQLSQRFHNLALRVFHKRLIAATTLGGRALILECYHPAVRLTEPEIHCDYLSTDGLENAELLTVDGASSGAQLSHYNHSYSRFYPHRHDADDTKPPLRHPAGDVPGSRTYLSSQPPAESSRQSKEDEDRADRRRVKQLIHLDPGELFTQLQATTMLVQPGRKLRWFLTTAVVSDGVLRLFRSWLARQAESEAKRDPVGLQGQKSTSAEKEPETSQRMDGAGASISNASPTRCADEEDQEGLVWVNDGKNVGVRFTVRERRWRRDNPILVRSDEELAVSYEIQFEEVLVRTRHLLIVIEESLAGQQNISNNAIIVGPRA